MAKVKGLQIYRLYIEDKIPVRPQRDVRRGFPPAFTKLTGFEIFPNLNSIKRGLVSIRNIGFDNKKYLFAYSLEGNSNITVITTGNSKLQWTSTSSSPTANINQEFTVGDMFLSRYYFVDNSRYLKYISGSTVNPVNAKDFGSSWRSTAAGVWGARLVVNRRDSNQHTFYFSDTGSHNFNTTDNWIQVHTNTSDPIIGFATAQGGLWIICKYSLFKLDGLLPTDTLLRKVGEFDFGDENINYRVADTSFGLMIGTDRGIYIAKNNEIKQFYGVPSVPIEYLTYRAGKLLYCINGDTRQWYLMDLQTEEAVTLKTQDGDFWIWYGKDLVYLPPDETSLYRNDDNTKKADVEVEVEEFEFDSAVVVEVEKIGISGKLGSGTLTVRFDGGKEITLTFDDIQGFEWFRMPPYATSHISLTITATNNPADAYLNHIDFLVRPKYRQVNEIPFGG